MNALAQNVGHRSTRNSFDAEWRRLRDHSDHRTFELTPNGSVRKTIKSHFGALGSADQYGVYVIRATDESVVLYIGKAGTVAKDGTIKNQNLPGRLTNTRGSKVSSKDWFGRLLAQHGPLVVEYVILQSSPVSPALAEAKLLQAFLNDFGRLPCENACL